MGDKLTVDEYNDEDRPHEENNYKLIQN